MPFCYNAFSLHNNAFLISKVYETKPLVSAHSPLLWANMNFLNVTISFYSDLSPKEMLFILKTIERKMGRKTIARWAPRIIDLDIIFVGQKVINESKNIFNFLIIPHEEFLNRIFFLIPVVEILPNYIHPILGISVLDIFNKMFLNY